jgi:hypothetical protein
MIKIDMSWSSLGAKLAPGRLCRNREPGDASYAAACSSNGAIPFAGLGCRGIGAFEEFEQRLARARRRAHDVM